MTKKIIASVCLLILLFLGVSCTEQGKEHQSIDDKISYELDYNLQGDTKASQFWPNPELKKAFASYWEYRFKLNMDKAWELEAPHVQFLGSKDAYKRFYSKTMQKKLSSVQLTEVQKIHSDLLAIVCQLQMGEGDQDKTSDILDHWVRVDGKWYHLPKNPIIFPFMRS